MRIFRAAILLALVFPTVGHGEVKPEGWRNESELSIARATGNAETETYAAKEALGYQFSSSVLKLSGHYLYGTARAVENARNWDAALRYEKELSGALSGYLGHQYEGDPFVGFDLRVSAATGLKHYFRDIDRDKNYIFAELGYTFAYEERIPGAAIATLTSHFARAYGEWRQPITDTTSLRNSLEVLQDFAHTDNLQINFDTSLQVTMTKVLSLKVGYTGRYRRTPVAVGNRNFDGLLAVSLIAKYVPDPPANP